MQRQADVIQKIELGKEFRIRIKNNRIHRVKAELNGTPVYITCTSKTGIKPPDVIPIYNENIIEIHPQEDYEMGVSYSFIIDQLEKVVKSYEKPPVEKSVAGLQWFRKEIEDSQLELDKKFSGHFLSFDSSYYNRTLGQIVIQYKLEEQIGDLTSKLNGFSGAGMGAIQALSLAVGIGSEELNKWFVENLYYAIRRSSPIRYTLNLYDFFMNNDRFQLRTKPIEKEIRHLFKAKDINGRRTNRDITVKECKKDIYLPQWDMSRKTIVVNRNDGKFDDMPVYIACCMSVFDPIYFRTKSRDRYIKNLGIINVDVVKNNDVYLKRYNPNLTVTSIGSPVRCYDKGKGDLDERSPATQLLNIKHDTDLDWSRSCGSKRLECNPVDELEQFPRGDRDISIGQKSGDINV